MCTLILATRLFDDSATFLASNRDENLARPAVGPLLWNDRSLPVVAPRDEKAGGTWLGVNSNGVLAAITNRYGTPPDFGRRSRGELVLTALEEPSADLAASRIAAEAATDYNPFHLLFADAESAAIVWSDGSTLRRVELEPGVHVVTERSFDAAPNGRADFLRQSIEAMRADGGLSRDGIARLLQVRRVDDFDATCILVPELDYGTRSSALVDVGRRELHFADGAPCEVDYDDRSPLLREVLS